MPKPSSTPSHDVPPAVLSELPPKIYSLKRAIPLRPRTTNMDDLAQRAGSSPRFSFDIAAEAVSHALTKAKTTSKS